MAIIDSANLSLKLLIRFEDSMNRQLCNMIDINQNGVDLAKELVFYGLVNEVINLRISSISLNFVLEL